MTEKESSAFLRILKRSLHEECYGERCSFEEVTEVRGHIEPAVSIKICLGLIFVKR